MGENVLIGIFISFYADVVIGEWMRLRHNEMKAQRAERSGRKAGLASAMVLTAGLMLPACKSGMSALNTGNGSALPVCPGEVTKSEEGERIRKEVRKAIDDHIQFMWDRTESVGVLFRSAKLSFTVSLRVNESGAVEVQDVSAGCEGDLCARFAKVLEMGKVALDGVKLPAPGKACGWDVQVALKLIGS